MPLRSGGRDIFVGDPEESDGICFFWHTSDRIHIVNAPKMSEKTAGALADSIQ